MAMMSSVSALSRLWIQICMLPHNTCGTSPSNVHSRREPCSLLLTSGAWVEVCCFTVTWHSSMIFALRRQVWIGTQHGLSWRYSGERESQETIYTYNLR